MNTIKNMMNNSDEALDYFNAAVHEVAGANSLLAERRISDLLKTIAYFSKLYTIFETALKNFNYRAEYKRATVEGGGRQGLKLPTNHLKRAAFVFCLLLEFDTEKRDLKDFTDTYYYHSAPAYSYRLFLDAVIFPFRDSVNYLYVNGCDSLLEESAVDESVRTAAGRLLSEIEMRTAGLTSEIGPDKKQEITVLLSAVSDSLTPNRIDLLPALLLGLKNTVAGSLLLKDALSPAIAKLYKTLAAGGLL